MSDLTAESEPSHEIPIEPSELFAVEGLGTVGVRVVRELVSSRPSIGVEIIGSTTERFEAVSSALGPAVRRGSNVSGVSLAILSGASGDHAAAATRWLERGVDVISMSDDLDDVTALLALDARARELDRCLLVGSAASPGLTCLLTRHAAAALDQVNEIHVASFGAGGAACLRQRQRQLLDRAREWRDGEWVDHAGGSGKELCWFPDPVGAKDCARGALADPLLLTRAFPQVRRVTSRTAVAASDRVLGFLPQRNKTVEGDPGAVRVEVRGVVGIEPTTLVYAVHDRLGAAAAALTGVVASTWSEHRRPGAYGVAELIEPLPVLRELARRGVKAATYS